MQKTNINPACLQAMLESASNAADKGQSQFYSPIPFGKKLAEALPTCRPTILDLTAGAGHLLEASARRSGQAGSAPGGTLRLLASDIDPSPHLKPGEMDALGGGSGPLPVLRITQDLTRLYSFLKEVDFLADCMVLNPPWRLFWYRERLAALAESGLPAVRLAFKAHENGGPLGAPISEDCIDSTIATYLIALDLLTSAGEGFLIANNATLQRLLFDPGAPHAAAAVHVWARLIIPGNPMTSIQGCNFQETMETGVIYFAPGHTAGPRDVRWPDNWRELLAAENNPSTPSASVTPSPAHLVTPSRSWRLGPELRNPYCAHDETYELWCAVREKIGELNGNKPKTPYNLWLENGRIKTALSLFENHSTKVDKNEAARLFALQGQAPMELVLQRHSRDELIHVAERAQWRVAPALLDAVHTAIQQYQAERAPLYPLPEMQRLGYLDEEDFIECKLDLVLCPSGTDSGPSTINHEPSTVLFEKGQRYPIRTQTLPVKRTVKRPSAFTGEMEDLEYSGQELCFFLTVPSPTENGGPSGTEPDAGTEYTFMDATLKSDPTVEIPDARRVKNSRSSHSPLVTGHSPHPKKHIDFTTAQLAAQFVIPDVPDVATVNPERYGQALEQLSALERLTEMLPT